VTSRRVVVAVVVGVVAALGACAGGHVRDLATTTAGVIATARDHGAQRCAPVELATAEVDNAAAEHELDEGNYAIAKDRADAASVAARAAFDKSPPDKCTDKVARDGDADGDGIPDSRDKCPHEAEDKDGFQDEDGCPDPDNDGDGIPDALDKCPNDPEDFDGFQDADGCPDLDNDKDGFYDAIDKCPNDPEDFDGFEDEDGCPDPDNDQDGFADAVDKCPNEAGIAPDGCPRKYDLVVVTETKIELKQTVFFDTNKATIKLVSYKLLDEVAQALQDHPKIQVEVQGHTDSQGDDDFNLKLSQRRAAAVRDYLIGRKVDPDRMVAKGYGENVPIADNRTAEGRSMNRRVEFVITAR
jgi:outer membrane protein OmpA-like peptidoglycan-associated protein